MKTKLKVKNKKSGKEVNKKPFNFAIQNVDEKDRLLRFFLILQNVDNKLKKQQAHI